MEKALSTDHDGIVKDDFERTIKETVENMLSALEGDPIAKVKLGEQIVKSPFAVRDTMYWYKFQKIVNGVYENPSDKIKLSDKLFGNPKDRTNNGMRIMKCIEKIDTEDILQCVINATRSMLLDLISVSDYFRIVKALTECLLEDLQFLQMHIIENKCQRGNINVFSLEHAGLMIMAGIDGNEDVENQEYTFTYLGKMVDCFAVSFEDEERTKWYKTHAEKLFQCKNDSQHGIELVK